MKTPDTHPEITRKERITEQLSIQHSVKLAVTVITTFYYTGRPAHNDVWKTIQGLEKENIEDEQCAAAINKFLILTQSVGESEFINLLDQLTDKLTYRFREIMNDLDFKDGNLLSLTRSIT